MGLGAAISTLFRRVAGWHGGDTSENSLNWVRNHPVRLDQRKRMEDARLMGLKYDEYIWETCLRDAGGRGGDEYGVDAGDFDCLIA